MKKQISIVALLALVAMQSCSPFSDLHTARMTGKGAHEITPLVSSRVQIDEGELSPDPILGMHYSYGAYDQVDVRFSVRASSAGIWIHGGPKFSLWQNRLALYIPIGSVIPYYLDTERVTFGMAELQPTLLYSHPLVQNKLEWNASAKWIERLAISQSTDIDSYAFNTSLSFSSDLRKKAFILEFGTLRYANSEFRESYAYQLSLGMIYKL